MKIGRNDPCPCMSGQKYKKCCEVTGTWKIFKENKGWNYYNEKHVLETLYLNDEKFRDFYVSERPKINRPIMFFQEQKRDSKMSYGNINNDFYYIVSEYSQIPINESVHIAHELEHLVLCSIGYKMLSIKSTPPENIKLMKRILNDMIYDPIVNRSLIDFGYNIDSYLSYQDDIQIKNIGINSKDQVNTFLVMVLYVKRILDYRNIDSRIRKDNIPFIQWVNKNYSQVILQSETILEIIEEEGMSTIDEVERSFVKIIEYLCLDEYLFLE
jgi:hypothetical protein